MDKGKAGTGPYIIEASSGGCNPDDSCIASYLTAAAEYTYLACFADSPTFNEVPAFRRRVIMHARPPTSMCSVLGDTGGVGAPLPAAGV